MMPTGPLQKLIISAPFGNYLSFHGATSTLGTFTIQNRGGLLYRLWRCALTLRYHRSLGAWTNRLGLPNPGIKSLPMGGDYSDKIISIHGFTNEEWTETARVAAELKPLAVELNLSCPNVGHRQFSAIVGNAVGVLLECSIPIIAKLPPIRPFDMAMSLRDRGVEVFHCCNTIPCPAGGMSGKPLKQFSLWAAQTIKHVWGDEVTVIGGGGITTPEDVHDYLKAGADHIAIGSMLLNPFNWRKVAALVAAANSQPKEKTR